MAWTEKIASGKHAGKYRGRYRDSEDRKRTVDGGPFTHKAEALRKAGAKEDEQRTPGAIKPEAGAITYGAWLAKWLDSHRVETSTMRQYESTGRLHVLPYWETEELREISMMRGNKWVKRLQAEAREGAKNPRTPWTIRIAVQMFVASINAAVEDKRLPSNPVKGLKWPDLPDTGDRYLTPEEVDAIGFHLTDHHQLILDMFVSTGLRAGELGGLHISRVDLANRRLSVIEQYEQHDKVIKPCPKDKEKRYVPISADLVKRLREHIMTLRRTGDCGVPHTAGRCPGGALVFAGPRGGAFRSSEWGKGPFADALGKAKIEGRVRVHDLRHTFASWVIQEGVSLAELARVMGHSSWEVTKRYAHLSDEGYDAVRDAITTRRGRGAERRAEAETNANHEGVLPHVAEAG